MTMRNFVLSRYKKLPRLIVLGGLCVRLNGRSWTSLGFWFMRLLCAGIIGRISKNIWRLWVKQIKEFFLPKFKNITGNIHHYGFLQINSQVLDLLLLETCGQVKLGIPFPLECNSENSKKFFVLIRLRNTNI